MAQDAKAVKDALSNFADAPLANAAKALLNALGYESERTGEVGTVAEFLERYEAKLTDRHLALFESWRDVELVFQVTDEEVAGTATETGFDDGRNQSFLFIAADLAEGVYSRTKLAEMTRAVNRLFAMPVVLIFRCVGRFSVAVVHRRAHRRDDRRDVLERVTLVKDVDVQRPHRAHLEALADLGLSRLVGRGVSNFDSLHRAWEDALDAEELNRRFYKELFEWFKDALTKCKFPDDGEGDGNLERHVIRLITRLLFIWFLKEKSLVPDDIFTEKFAAKALKRHAPGATDYYRAVLQNLFFATLNTEIEKRAFSKVRRRTHRDFTKYRYRKLLADPDGFLAKLKMVPFVNGGLFDCLDDFEGETEGGRRIDAFTDNIETQGKALHVPASIFLDSKDGLFALFRRFKFTVEENTPLDQEVALDPELLGRVFENLLAAYNPETRNTVRKATGSYYTPRRIVDYIVDEALVRGLAERIVAYDGDAKWLDDRLRYLLDYADAFDDAIELFDDDERKSIVQAIANLRILDPAVGSGAFPMGALHKLTLALRRIDPDNDHWQRLQKELATARTATAFERPTRGDRDAELLEISSTFETYRDSDFGRKLYLIQNGIFGVDLQPVACQIARLRFFISLIVEQQPTRDAASNYGIRPLPNLETRIVAADALTRIAVPSQLGFGEQAVAEHIAHLRRVREMHFNARTRDEKRALRDQDAALRDDLAAALKDSGFGHDEATRVAKWDPYRQNTAANWFDPQWMFGVKDGFDVVIGNPPYVQLQRDRGTLRRRYQGEAYDTFAATGDLYQLFFERGMGLLRSRGILAYITSNSWLKAKYGESTRSFFSAKHAPRVLLEVGKDVFDSAIVDSSVLVAQEGQAASDDCLALDMDSLDAHDFPPQASRFGSLYHGGTKPWVPLSSLERGIMDKMQQVGVPLKEWDISIYYGVKTGYNAAFVVDDATRKALMDEDPRSEDLLKPILRGRDIRPYRAQWAGLWLIDVHNGFADTPPVDVTDYPAVKRHLDAHWEAIARRQDKGVTPYNLRNCSYHEEFSKPKLLWMDMSPEGRFCYSEEHIFSNDKAFLMTGRQLKYLCALLNSSLVTWYIEKTALTTGEGLIQWKKFTVQSIPCPHPSDQEDERYVSGVDLVISQDEDVAGAAHAELDEMVLDTYKLNGKERQHILGRTPSSTRPTVQQ